MEVNECPFLCGWKAEDAEPVVVGVDNALEKLQLHLRVEHHAYPERDVEAWEDGSWADIMFPDEGVALD